MRVQFSSVQFILFLITQKVTKHRLQIHIYKNINILSINSIKEESLNSKASDKPPPPPLPDCAKTVCSRLMKLSDF